MKNALIAIAWMLCPGVAGAQVDAGDMAPEISLPDTKGTTFSLSSLRGSVVLIDFWASWCSPCRESNPAIARLYRKYKARGFEVLGVSIDSKRGDWLRAIARDRLKYAQVNDAGGWNSAVATRYGVNQIPASFLLDRAGKVIALDLEGKALEDRVKQLLR